MKICTKLICALLLLATLLTLAACGGKEDPPAESTGGQQTTGGDATDEPRNDVADLPEDLDFKGKTFTIRSIVQAAAAREFEASLDGSIIDQAVYNRNRALEEKYGCLIMNDEDVGNTNTTQMFDEVNNMVKGGLYNNQILVTASYRMCALAMNGLLTNIRTMNAIDEGKDYYSQGYNEALSIGDAQYLITGKFSMAYYRYIIGMFYNRQLFNDFGVENPQELVLNQEWTMEKAAEIVKDMYVDQGSPADNTYGYVCFVGGDSSVTDGFMSATGMTVLTKDENNYYQVSVDTARFSSAVDKILGLLYGESSYATTEGDHAKYFTDSHAGMMNYRLYIVESEDMVRLGHTGLGYGLLPIPKMDSSQEDYISYVQDQCFAFGFPISMPEEEKQQVALFFEAYASDSYQVVKSTYYERTLTSRYLDEPSVQIMEIIDTNVYVDPVNVYLVTAFSFTTQRLRQIYGDPAKYNIATILAEYLTSGLLEEEVNEVNTTFQEIANGTFEPEEEEE